MSTSCRQILRLERCCWWSATALYVFSEPVVEVIDEEAGTLTLTFDDTHRGVPFKWRVPGEGVILLDAGTVNIVVTVRDRLGHRRGHLLRGDIVGHARATSITHPAGERDDEIFCGAMGA